ncbi:MAG TPA: methionyl-tRNA formyltransferase [Candidatus Saccharimonadales bacterium]|nr:methionyl-tRNA formyltransferase [Candidatus Saccharimonadales bacterium]
MSGDKIKIIFFGNEQIATGVSTTAPTLQALIEAGYDISAVVANSKDVISRNNRQLRVKDVAKDHNIPFIVPDDIRKLTEELKKFRADAGVLVAFGRIVPQEIIDIFPGGIINIHPSLLPLHRGPTPIESVILNSDKKTGVSLMKLERTMDSGPVYAQSEINIDSGDTKQELADKLLEIGKTMLIELLPDILTGRVIARPQDESRATYDGLISKEDGVIDWSKSATVIEHEIRAYSGWPKSRTKLADIDCIITEAEVSEADGKPGDYKKDKDLLIFTGDGSLSIKRIQPSGKREMTAEEFLRGYGPRL